MPLLFREEWLLGFHPENTLYKSCHFWKFGRKNLVFSQLHQVLSGLRHVCWPLGEGTPLTGLKTPALDAEPIPIVMVTNSSIFGFLDLVLKAVCLSFDFWIRKFLKIDTWPVEDEDKLIPHFGQNLWSCPLQPPQLWQRGGQTYKPQGDHVTCTSPRFQSLSASGLVTSNLKFGCFSLLLCIRKSFCVLKKMFCSDKACCVLKGKLPTPLQFTFRMWTDTIRTTWYYYWMELP